MKFGLWGWKQFTFKVHHTPLWAINLPTFTVVQSSWSTLRTDSYFYNTQTHPKYSPSLGTTKIVVVVVPSSWFVCNLQFIVENYSCFPISYHLSSLLSRRVQLSNITDFALKDQVYWVGTLSFESLLEVLGIYHWGGGGGGGGGGGSLYFDQQLLVKPNIS